MLLPDVFDDFDNFDDDFLMEPFDFRTHGKRNRHGRAAMMSTDIKEHDNDYEISLELPGFKKEDIKADLSNGYLTINASHTENDDKKDKKGRYIRRERYTGQCQRSFYVGDSVKQEDIKAGFENGVLKLTIPKTDKNKKLENKNYIAIEG